MAVFGHVAVFGTAVVDGPLGLFAQLARTERFLHVMFVEISSDLPVERVAVPAEQLDDGSQSDGHCRCDFRYSADGSAFLAGSAERRQCAGVAADGCDELVVVVEVLGGSHGSRLVEQ